MTFRYRTLRKRMRPLRLSLRTLSAHYLGIDNHHREKSQKLYNWRQRADLRGFRLFNRTLRE